MRSSAPPTTDRERSTRDDGRETSDRIGRQERDVGTGSWRPSHLYRLGRSVGPENLGLPTRAPHSDSDANLTGDRGKRAKSGASEHVHIRKRELGRRLGDRSFNGWWRHHVLFGLFGHRRSRTGVDCKREHHRGCERDGGARFSLQLPISSG